MSRSCLPVVLLSLALTLAGWGAEPGVKITQQPDKLRVEIDGQLFTEYHFAGAPHVYFYPVLGPGGTPMTRNWPMKDVPGTKMVFPGLPDPAKRKEVIEYLMTLK